MSSAFLLLSARSLSLLQPASQLLSLAGATWRLHSEWNPKTDKHLPVNYDITDFVEGKRACKMKLQEEMGLPVNGGIPLVAFIGRLDPQKGADILMAAVPEVRAFGQDGAVGS